uniref:Uv radiation resistance-associated protein n=1 Tax=Triatoma infestans TaxID=30076 RepID=A0A170U425_TRIIF
MFQQDIPSVILVQEVKLLITLLIPFQIKIGNFRFIPKAKRNYHSNMAFIC